MFPAFLMPALIGGGLGLLTSKKDPLKGALLGAGLGAAGGLLGPALAPAAGAGGAISGSALAAESAALGVPFAGGATLPGSAIGGTALAQEAAGLGVPAPGLSGMDAFNQTLGKLKPAGDAIGTGLQVAGMFEKPDTPIIPSPTIQYASGNQTMDGLLSNMQGQQNRQLEDAQRKREMRRHLIRGMA